MDEKKKVREWIETTFALSWKDEIELSLAWGVLKRKGPIMKEVITRFWTDPAYFTAACRSLATLIATLVLTGVIPVPESISHQVWWTAVVLPALSQLFPAGQTNRTDQQIRDVARGFPGKL